MRGKGSNFSLRLAVFINPLAFIASSQRIFFKCCMRMANYFCIRMAETDDEIQSDIDIMLKWAQSSHNVMDVIKTIIKDGYTSLQAAALLSEEDLTDLSATLPAKGKIFLKDSRRLKTAGRLRQARGAGVTSEVLSNQPDVGCQERGSLPGSCFGPATSSRTKTDDTLTSSSHHSSSPDPQVHFNPSYPNDALKHHITSMRTDLIFLQLRILEWKLP